MPTNFSPTMPSILSRERRISRSSCIWHSSRRTARSTPEQDTQPFLGKFQEKDSAKPYNAMYAAMITRQDHEIGRVLQTLDDLKLADNTLLIYTSDNGATFEVIAKQRARRPADSNHPLRGQKRNLWEGGIREPAVVRWPGHVPAGAESHEVIHMTDVFPTACAAAGAVESAWKVDGENVLDALEGKSKIPERTLFWEWRYDGNVQFAAMRGDMKLVITGKNTPELFDVESASPTRLYRRPITAAGEGFEEKDPGVDGDGDRRKGRRRSSFQPRRFTRISRNKFALIWQSRLNEHMQLLQPILSQSIVARANVLRNTA